MSKQNREQNEKQDSPVNWSSWLREYGARLLLLARQQTRSEADAEDVMQDALIQLVHAVEGGSFRKGENQWFSYACTAIRHLAADLGRHSEVCRQYESRAQSEENVVIEEQPWLESSIDQEHLRRQIEKKLRELPKEFSEVVVLKIWGEFTFQQIAEMTGVKLPTVTSRYRYALQAMRKEWSLPD